MITVICELLVVDRHCFGFIICFRVRCCRCKSVFFLKGDYVHGSHPQIARRAQRQKVAELVGPAIFLADDVSGVKSRIFERVHGATLANTVGRGSKVGLPENVSHRTRNDAFFSLDGWSVLLLIRGIISFFLLLRMNIAVMNRKRR